MIPLRSNIRWSKHLLIILILQWVSTPLLAEIHFGNLVDVEGNSASPSDSIGQGKWTLVMIWATDCPICKAQKPEISAFYDRHKNNDADVFGIAIDGKQNRKAVISYIAEHNPTFPNYIGEISTVAQDYRQLTGEGFRGTPTYLLYNPQGELKGLNPGPVSINAIEKFMVKNEKP